MGGGIIEIRLLGGFEIRRDGAVQRDVPSLAARSLIALLALNAERPLPRDFVAGTLWPDRSDADARFQLRQALWQAGNAIGTDTILRDGGSLALDRSVVELDVNEFLWSIEQAAAAEEPDRRIELLEQAVRDYRGELMAGHYDFDDWMSGDREKVRHLYVGALDRLCDLHAAARRYDSALSLARGLVAEQPWDEKAHRRVMWLAATTGRTSEALRQYDDCVRMLEEEFGTAPAFETTDLYESILNARETGRTRALDADRPMVGRDHERSLVAAALDAAASGSGGVVLIEGDLGIGKSRLLDAIGSDAAWRGFGVAAVHGIRDQEPYGALRDLLADVGLEAVAEHLDAPSHDRIALLLDRRPTDGRLIDDHAALQAAAAQALTLLPQGRPACVLIDNGHQIDAASAAVVSRLGDIVGPHPIVIVIAYRHREARQHPQVWEAVRSLDRVPGRLRLSLGPFSPAQTEDLAAATLGHEVDTESAMALHRATGGIPYLIVESLRDPDAVADTDTAADAVRHLASRFVDRRTRDLPAGTLRTLRIAALGDRPMSRSVLAAVEAEGVRDLVSRGLVVSSGERFAVASDLVRSAVLADLTPSQREQLHGELADAIEHADPTAVDLIGRHLWESGEHERAAPYLVTAARHDIAVHEYESALERLDRADEGLSRTDRQSERLDVLRDRLQILDLLGRRDEQQAALDLFDDLAGEGDAGEALILRARWLAQGAEFDDARRAARNALEISEADPAGRVSALASLAMVECLAGDAARGVEILDEASSFGSVGTREQADARNALGQNLVDLQRFEEAETQLLASLALYRELDDVRGEIDVIGMLATIRMERGDTEGAAETYQRALEMSRRVGYREGEARCLFNLGVTQYLKGQPLAAARLLQDGARVYRLLGNGRGEAHALVNVSWIEHSVLGDHVAARTHAVQAIEYLESVGARRLIAQAKVVVASVEGLTGSPEAAELQMTEALEALQELQDHWLEAQAWREIALVQWINENPAAIESAQRSGRLCDRHGFEDIRATAAAVEVLATLDAGQAASSDVLETIRKPTKTLAQGHLILLARSAAAHAEGAYLCGDQDLWEAQGAIESMLDGLSAEEQQRAINSSPILRKVISKVEERKSSYSTSTVTRIDAPPRGSAPSEDLIEVTWLRDHPLDSNLDAIARRRSQVERLFKASQLAGGLPSIPQIARALDVSESTATRDARHLARTVTGFRTRGMARSVGTDSELVE